MPEPVFPPPARMHPRFRKARTEPLWVNPEECAYAELQTTSNFTFLTGASHPEEMVETAAALGLRALAITDRNTMGGVVRAHIAARDVGLPLIVGCRMDLIAATTHSLPVYASSESRHARSADCQPWASVLVYPTDRASYGRLCRLLTLGKRRAPKGSCDLALTDLLEAQEGLLAVLLPPEDPNFHPTRLAERCVRLVQILKDTFGERLSLAVSCLQEGDDLARLKRLADLADLSGVPLVATNDVHYHTPERRALQDVLTCVRHGCTLDEAGYRLFAHGERHLKTASSMVRLFAECPDAIERTIALAKSASAFSLDQLQYQYPEEACPAGSTPMQYLVELTHVGAARRYPHGVPETIERALEHEFAVIEDLGYAPYFLTVADLVRFSREQGILCQGRGAAANSVVCYCLGVTAVDPARVRLLFERFVSKERNEPPDIDIDFEHERREEVIQYVYRRYGRERAALTAEVITYRARSAVREVGKALGLSLDLVDRLAKNQDWWSDGTQAEAFRNSGVDVHDPTIARLRALCEQAIGFPRHRSQHVGGFVMTQDALAELVPIENAAMADRTVIEWDKDDIAAMNMMKVDILGLGMLTCVRKALDFVDAAPVSLGPADPEALRRFKAEGLSLDTIPAEDPAVYEMICKADTVGVFQIESRAQMSMLPRLRPQEFYDLVIEVAIVRPGPIHGGMVHPYLRRRSGEEAIEHFNPELDAILGKTLGVPLFQEQAMALAIVAGGFTPGEADALRRAMAAWKRKGKDIETFGRKLVDGMLARGYTREFADRCVRQIHGFSEYGFPESHAASFALLVYVSAWLKCHHPAAFAAALINSQPMGFYAPAQIIRDAKEHGVVVYPVDVNASQWDCTLEYQGGGRPALRLGMRLVKGLREHFAVLVSEAVRAAGPFQTPGALFDASGVRIHALRRLAYADAFGSMGLDRQAALWQLRSLKDEVLPLFDGCDVEQQREDPVLPAVTPIQAVLHDYASIHLSLKAHPIAFLRSTLRTRGCTRAATLQDPARWPHGRRASVGGVVLSRQRPVTANGIVFITLEDETGTANLIVRQKVFERYRSQARSARVLLVRGRVERQGDVVHVLAERLEGMDDALAELVHTSRDFR